MTYSDEKHINYIMDNFNFNRVKKTMDLLDIKWAWGADLRVPTIEEIKQTARKILEGVANQTDNVTCDIGLELESSGGLEAVKRQDWISLRFVLQETESIYLNFEDDYEIKKLNKNRKKKIKQLDGLSP